MTSGVGSARKRARAVRERRARSATASAPARAPAPRDRGGTEKLQKALADLGLGSRREIERWIVAGRVSVNGAVARLGARVAKDDRISVDGIERRGAHRAEHRAGERAGRREARVAGRVASPRVLIMNKAEGVICTRRDPQGRPTCFDGLPRLVGGRWIAVGRLDINSSGLLLFTNDGALAHALMHPSAELTREYWVRVDRALDATASAALTEGVLLPDGELARFAALEHVGGGGRNQWYRVALTEGRNREVRNLFESQGVRVSRLKRARYGPIVLPASLKRGRYEALPASEVALLYAQAGLAAPLPDRERPHARAPRAGRSRAGARRR